MTRGDALASKKTSTWVLGCGIGCAVIILLIAGAIGAGAVFVRRIGSGFEQANEASRTVEQRHGAPRTFTPSPDGSIPPARMEAFLQVREALGPARERLASAFSRLPMTPEKAEELKKKGPIERLVLGLGIAKDAMAIAPGIGDFFRARDEALLAAGMGMGEYAYIYTVAYESWLGHSPSAKPREGRDRRDGDELMVMGMSVRGRVHEDLLQILRNQLAALPADQPPAWRETLAAEIAALERSSMRSPWQDGLPPALSASLDPYRERLERTWSPATTAFELARTTRRGRFSYSAD